VSQKNQSDRLRRAEQQAAPQRDVKQQAVYNLLHNFAAAHPEMHSGSPQHRAATENKAVGILAAEMQSRLDAGKIQNPDISRALDGVQQFGADGVEDWE
jgi:hypothetical protein